jgi:DNA-binding NarL/FixJ family response regulator
MTVTLLIVIDRRELVLGCLSSWLRSFRREFEVLSAADAENSLSASEVARAGAVVLGSSLLTLPDPWLERQVTWLRDIRPEMPIVAIAEAGERVAAESMVARLHLQGYIPTSSTTKVAAAALRLVLAGGAYLPRHWEEDRRLPETPLNQMLDAVEPRLGSILTSRERAVLSLLSRGMANKCIAYELNMSKSTVKVHVHNIMAKLNVHNRTEAAVAAQNMLLAELSDGHEPTFDAPPTLGRPRESAAPPRLSDAKQSLPKPLR